MAPVVLAISSHVSASTVGLRATTSALLAHGVDAWPVPTVLFGRHPGWGGATPCVIAAEALRTQLADALRHRDAERIRWIITGYFANAAQVDAAADAIANLRASTPSLRVCVDPIMGDAETGLYVSEETAEAIAARLLPLADLVTPNAWEAERLGGGAANDAVNEPGAAAAAGRALGRPAAIVSSVRAKGRIGAVYVDAEHALFAHAEPREGAPRGTGDVLTAAFVGAVAAGAAPGEALLDAVRRVSGAIAGAVDSGGAELSASAVARGAAAPAAPAAIEAIDRSAG